MGEGGQRESKKVKDTSLQVDEEGGQRESKRVKDTSLQVDGRRKVKENRRKERTHPSSWKGEGRSKRIEESKEHILLGGWERIEESKGHIPLVGCEKGRSKRIEESKGYIPFSGKEGSVLVILVYTDETIAPLSYIHSDSTTLTYPRPQLQQSTN